MSCRLRREGHVLLDLPLLEQCAHFLLRQAQPQRGALDPEFHVRSLAFRCRQNTLRLQQVRPVDHLPVEARDA